MANFCTLSLNIATPWSDSTICQSCKQRDKTLPGWAIYIPIPPCCFYSRSSLLSQTPASQRNGSRMTSLPSWNLFIFQVPQAASSLLQHSKKTDTSSSRSQQQIHVPNKTFTATSYSLCKFPLVWTDSRSRANPLPKPSLLPCHMSRISSGLSVWSSFYNKRGATPLFPCDGGGQN